MLQVDLGCGQEHMDAFVFGWLKGLNDRVDVLDDRAGQTADKRMLNVLRDVLDRLKITL